MDIELPHHSIETRRDFFIHLFTITCGLLIALALEGFVEWAHHRALVHEARANIRAELQANDAAAEKNLRNIDANLAVTKADLKTEHALAADPKNFHGSLNFSFSWETSSEAAWQTARDTGALSFMRYSEVQRYADVYEEQSKIDRSLATIYEDDAQAYAPIASAGKDIDSLKPEELQRMLEATALTYTHLLFLKQTVSQLHGLYQKTLQAH